MRSIKSIYKIGNGPSSSHTVGPYHAAQVMKERYPGADRFEVTLFGSLAFTGEGHGTGKAIKSALPEAEIAEALGISVGAVKVRLHAARRKLKEILSLTFSG